MVENELLEVVKELLEDAMSPSDIFPNPVICEHLWLYVGLHVPTRMYTYGCGECCMRLSLRERDLLGNDPTDVKSISKILEVAIQDKLDWMKR